MAVTTENSVQMANAVGEPRTFNKVTDWHGRLRLRRFTFTQGAAAGDANSIARLVELPGSKVQLILPLSRIAFSAFGASRTLNLGWEAYTDDQNQAVAAAAAGLATGIDVSAAGSNVPSGVLGGDEMKLFASFRGVVLTAQVLGGTIPAGATLNGMFAYAHD